MDSFSVAIGVDAEQTRVTVTFVWTEGRFKHVHDGLVDF